MFAISVGILCADQIYVDIRILIRMKVPTMLIFMVIRLTLTILITRKIITVNTNNYVYGRKDKVEISY